jgi:chromosome partitioning protein
MRTIAVGNQKGGCGKTATAHALGVALSESRRVLLVDMDPQASLSGACGLDDAAGASVAEVLGAAEPGKLALADIIRPLGPTLALAPGDIALAVSELGLVSRIGRESVLRRALATVASDFDVAIIDCPPSLSVLTIAALAAADGVILPTQPQASDLRGLGLFMDTLAKVRDAINPSLELIGVLVTFWDGRLLHHKAGLAALQDAGLPLFVAKLGRSVRVAEAAGEAQTVLTYEPNNPRAAETRALALEVAAWLAR